MGSKDFVQNTDAFAMTLCANVRTPQSKDPYLENESPQVSAVSTGVPLVMPHNKASVPGSVHNGTLATPIGLPAASLGLSRDGELKDCSFYENYGVVGLATEGEPTHASNDTTIMRIGVVPSGNMTTYSLTHQVDVGEEVFLVPTTKRLRDKFQSKPHRRGIPPPFMLMGASRIRAAAMRRSGKARYNGLSAKSNKDTVEIPVVGRVIMCNRGAFKPSTIAVHIRNEVYNKGDVMEAIDGTSV